ncbi:MAG: polyphosphate kinase 2 family protein [Anaerolineaceae bacterium]
MEEYRIESDRKVSLKNYDPDDMGEWKDKKEKAQEELLKLCVEIGELQEILFAEHKHKVLIVFQAMDTGGKDGTIRSVFSCVNPQGVNVISFKVPSALELDHDYLWRVHASVPGKGQMTIFNRSHYEDVLVVRVHKLVPKEVWKKRYDQIREFEKTLAEEGTTIIKFFLHITREEQKERLLERIDIMEKRWKFNPGDLEERKLWEDYMEAYEDALSETSTERAPWYVIPANRNWYRNLCVARIIANHLRDLKMEYPSVVPDIEKYRSML